MDFGTFLRNKEARRHQSFHEETGQFDDPLDNYYPDDNGYQSYEPTNARPDVFSGHSRDQRISLAHLGPSGVSRHPGFQARQGPSYRESSGYLGRGDGPRGVSRGPNPFGMSKGTDIPGVLHRGQGLGPSVTGGEDYFEFESPVRGPKSNKNKKKSSTEQYADSEHHGSSRPEKVNKNAPAEKSVETETKQKETKDKESCSSSSTAGHRRGLTSILMNLRESEPSDQTSSQSSSSSKPSNTKTQQKGPDASRKKAEDARNEESTDTKKDDDDKDNESKKSDRHNRGLMNTLMSLMGSDDLKEDSGPSTTTNQEVNEKADGQELEEEYYIEHGITPSMLEEAETELDYTDELEPDDHSEFFCKLCQVPTTSIGNFRDHLNGKSHKAAYVAFKHGKPLPSSKSRRKTVGAFLPSEIGTKSFVLEMLQDVQDPILGLSYVTEFHSAMGITCVCNLCGAKFDRNIAQSHTTGVKHRLHYLKNEKPRDYAYVKQFGGKRSKLTNFLDNLFIDLERSDGRGHPRIKLYEPNMKNDQDDKNDDDDMDEDKQRLKAMTRKNVDPTAMFQDWVDKEMERGKVKSETNDDEMDIYQNSGRGRFRDGSPGRFRDGSPGRFRDGSPGRFRDGSPGRFRDGSPGRKRDKSRERSPGRKRDKSRERSPSRKQRRSPGDTGKDIRRSSSAQRSDFAPLPPSREGPFPPPRDGPFPLPRDGPFPLPRDGPFPLPRDGPFPLSQGGPFPIGGPLPPVGLFDPRGPFPPLNPFAPRMRELHRGPFPPMGLGPLPTFPMGPRPHPNFPLGPGPHPNFPLGPGPHPNFPLGPGPHPSLPPGLGPHPSLLLGPRPHPTFPMGPGPRPPFPMGLTGLPPQRSGSPGPRTDRSPNKSRSRSPGRYRARSPGGRVRSRSPGGRVRSRTPGGRVRSRTPGGRVRSRTPSGGIRSRSPDGRVRSRSPSGIVRSRTPGGRIHGRSPGGRIHSRSPKSRVRSRSPGGRARSRSPGGRVRSRSPGGRVRDRSPGSRVRSRSPGGRFRDRSPGILRTGSPGKFRGTSPGRLRMRSPDRFRRGSPGRFRDGSPGRFRDGSPGRFRDRSPGRKRDRSRERSPRRKQRRSPDGMRGRSPDGIRGRSPVRMQGRFPDNKSSDSLRDLEMRRREEGIRFRNLRDEFMALGNPMRPRIPEPPLDPDPVRRLDKLNAIREAERREREKALIARANVIDYGHRDTGKPQSKKEKWEDDILHILGQNKSKNAPDSLALLSGTYSDSSPSPPPKKKPLPFSKSYLEQHQERKRSPPRERETSRTYNRSMSRSHSRERERGKGKRRTRDSRSSDRYDEKKYRSKRRESSSPELPRSPRRRVKEYSPPRKASTSKPKLDEDSQAEAIANMLLQMTKTFGSEVNPDVALKALFTNTEVANALRTTLKGGPSKKRSQRSSSSSERDYRRRRSGRRSPPSRSPSPVRRKPRERFAFSLGGSSHQATLSSSLPLDFARDDINDD